MQDKNPTEILKGASPHSAQPVIAAFERSVVIPAQKPVVADPWGKMRSGSEKNAQTDTQPLAVNVLAENCELSKQQIKQVMQNGAVWLRRKNKKVKRVRRAKTVLRPGDEISISYDPYVQMQQVQEPQLIADEGRYTVWNKPAGMLSQGSKYGDHCAITRWVEKNSEKSRQVYLVHRLDRAASGLILLAHDSKLAADLSELFQSREIEKTYQVCVHGNFEQTVPFKIDASLDGKSAISIINQIRQAKHAGSEDRTDLTVNIETGRKHQIRRHLADLGFPVVGDHLYGSEADRDIPMQLTAVQLQFKSPLNQQVVTYSVD